MELIIKTQDIVKEIETAFLIDDFKAAQTFKQHIMTFLNQLDKEFAETANKLVLESEGYKTSLLEYLKRNDK